MMEVTLRLSSASAFSIRRCSWVSSAPDCAPAASVARRSSGVTTSAVEAAWMCIARSMASDARLNSQTSGRNTRSANAGNQATSRPVRSGACMAIRLGNRSANSTNNPVTRQNARTEAVASAHDPSPARTSSRARAGLIMPSPTAPPNTPTALRQIWKTVITRPLSARRARNRTARLSPFSAACRIRGSRAAAKEISDNATTTPKAMRAARRSSPPRRFMPGRLADVAQRCLRPRRSSDVACYVGDFGRTKFTSRNASIQVWIGTDIIAAISVGAIAVCYEPELRFWCDVRS